MLEPWMIAAGVIGLGAVGVIVYAIVDPLHARGWGTGGHVQGGGYQDGVADRGVGNGSGGGDSGGGGGGGGGD